MYQPSFEILKKYSDILVKFALWGGNGVRPGDVVFVQLPECAKSFYIPLQQSILEAGAHPIFDYIPNGIMRHFYEVASDNQIEFYPSLYLEGKLAQMTHIINVHSLDDVYELKSISPQKISSKIKSRQGYIDGYMKKQINGEVSSTVCLYGTQSMADEVGMSLEKYWEQIIKACYLDQENPIESWTQTFSIQNQLISSLNDMNIQKLHIVGQDMDLFVQIGSYRKWLGGAGQNIPSFEIFTSPDFRGTEGWIRFNQPLYRYGQKIVGIFLRFESGNVVEFSATEGQELLEEIFTIPGTRMLGEFSLTDNRLSHITKIMGEILYDENIGGPYGNMHVAIGFSFADAYNGNIGVLSEEQKINLGFNQSVEHLDIITTVDRTVIAYLEDDSEVLIYQNGKFII